MHVRIRNLAVIALTGVLSMTSIAGGGAGQLKQTPASSITTVNDEQRIASIYATLSQLQTVRSQIELYRIMHDGQSPDFSKGWTMLQEEGLLPTLPANPLASPKVATLVKVVNEAGREGDVCPATEAGWVWNTADGRFYPAGVTVAELNGQLEQYAATHAPKSTPGATPPDGSLSLEQYIHSGAPAHDRSWSGTDMTRMLSVLRQLSAEHPEQLPRCDSDRSGEAFSRICAAQNLGLFTQRRIPVAQRLPEAIEYLQSSNEIAMLYLDAYNRGVVGSRELVEVHGHMLRMCTVLMELVNEFMGQQDPEMPGFEFLSQGVDEMKSGMGTMVAGTLISLSERHVYSVTDLRRLMVYMQETFPSIVPQLPAGSRTETLARLEFLTNDPAMNDLSTELTRLRQSCVTALSAAAE